MSSFKVRIDVVIAFALIMILVAPIMLMTSQSAMGQKNETSLASNNNKSTAQALTEAALPTQEGFSVRVLATNFSSPHNILYGPDNALWITERVGKNISRVDPDTGEKLSTIRVPNVHQSGGQDGLMGMAFDPDFNNTNYIYVAYTYDADSGNDLERRTKITRFTYDSQNASIGQPLDLMSGL